MQNGNIKCMNDVLEITKRCVGCDACIAICPEDAIAKDQLKNYYVDNWSCTICGLCIEICPVDCIKFKPPLDII